MKDSGSCSQMTPSCKSPITPTLTVSARALLDYITIFTRGFWYPDNHNNRSEKQK